MMNKKEKIKFLIKKYIINFFKLNILVKLYNSISIYNKEKIPLYADSNTLEKAITTIERYREIISDPINLLIDRVPEAGYVDANNCVTVHNGNKVPILGDLVYYDNFSQILIINRGVHEPLEEYCFQQTLKNIKSELPSMIELGAYWAHYSMWFMKEFSRGKCFLIEPNLQYLECGKNNFRINKFEGEFINNLVDSSESGFQLDKFIQKKKLNSLDVLHADIQGYEIEMIDGCSLSLQKKIINYIFISTHSESLHKTALNKLVSFGYRIEISSEFNYHTTSSDGFIMASSPKINPIFNNFLPLGRVDIIKSTPQEIIKYLISTSK